MLKRGFYILFFSLLISGNLLALSSAPTVNLQIKAKQAILMDYHSGAVLFDKNGHEKMSPSSMTKIMTIYLIFDAIKKGTITLDQTFHVSQKARNLSGSRMFVEAGSFVPVEELIKGTIVSSGNDSSLVIAEGLAGDESVFAIQMTDKARDLGAKNTLFLEAHGLPKEGHYSTAFDLAQIALGTIKNFPKLYESYYSMVKYKYNNIEQYTHNTLLRASSNRADYKVDGMKTGFTDDGGYGLVFSAVKNGTRLIGVVNGLKEHKERISAARVLLQWGFHQNSTMPLFAKSESYFSLPVESGKTSRVPVSAKKDVFATYPNRLGKEGLKFKLQTLKTSAPISKGDLVANLFVEGTLVPHLKVPLYADTDIEPQSLISILYNKFLNIFGSPERASENETLKIVRNSLIFQNSALQL